MIPVALPVWWKLLRTVARRVLAVMVPSVAICAQAAPAATYTLGGTIQGLSASGLVLASGAQVLTIAPGATAFTFPGALNDGAAYAVVVSDSPAGLDCNVVANGFGVVSGSNIKNVAIDCVASASGSTVLYAFATGAVPFDGKNPRAALLEARDGNFYGTTFAGGARGLGTVFRLTRAGAATIVHSFGGQAQADGANPTAALMEASDGNLYGATLIGGPANTGTVFRITPAGVYSVIYAFERVASGGNFGGISRLIEGRDGFLYGATILGGPNGTGTIVRISRSGTAAIISSFGPMHSGDGSNPQGPLVQARDGYLYGTTVQGGANGMGTIFRVDPANGAHATIYSFGPAGSGDGAGPYGGLLEVAPGRFYGTTGSGGSTKVGTVYELHAGPNAVTTVSIVHSFQGLGSGDGMIPAGELILGRDGNIYGSTPVGGANGAGVLFKLSPGGAESIIHAFGKPLLQDGSGPADGPIQGRDGALYGTTSNGGPRNQGTVYRIQP